MTDQPQPTRMNKMQSFSQAIEEIANDPELIKKEEKPYRHKIVACMDQMVTSHNVWAVANALAKQNSPPIKGDDCVQIYHYSDGFHNRFSQSIRERFFHYHQKMPGQFGFDIQQKQPSTELRTAVAHYLRSSDAKFAVMGLEIGMSAQLLGDSNDVSFRQVSNTTAVIVKQDIFVADPHATWAILVDASDEAEYAFNVVIDHIKEGDKVHLLYPRPPATNNEFVNDDTGGKYIFTPFRHQIEKRFPGMHIEEHVIEEPNVGVALTAFANHRKRHVHYLVVYCDLIKEYIAQKDLMGSVSDYCARHANCAVIIPKYAGN